MPQVGNFAALVDPPDGWFRICSEEGGSAPVQILKPTGAVALPGVGDALTVTPQAVQQAVSKLTNG